VKKEYLFKSGKYYIGDPCYVISSDSARMIYAKADATQQLFSYMGHKFFCAYTKYGDGSYYDNNRKEYAVDSCKLGIIPIAIIEFEKRNIDNMVNCDLGHIYDFKDDFVVSIDGNGRFMFNDIVIETDDESE